MPIDFTYDCTPQFVHPTYKFTGKQRDGESGNDYFNARYCASNMGRFMSPDLGWFLAAELTNPQTWNQYSYALNNPLSNVDPNGLDCVYFNAAGDAAESIDQNSNSGECGTNGGDWVNGTTSSSQIQYNAGNDTFNIQSSDNQNSYSTTASAPGSQTNGTPCYGNCDTPYGYTQIPNDALSPYAQGVISQVGLQIGPTYKRVDRFLRPTCEHARLRRCGRGSRFQILCWRPKEYDGWPIPWTIQYSAGSPDSSQCAEYRSCSRYGLDRCGTHRRARISSRRGIHDPSCGRSFDNLSGVIGLI